MTAALWSGLDWLGHHIPLLRFGRVRHWICVKTVTAKVEEEER